MKLFVFPFLLIAVLAVSYEDISQEWETFKQTHGKKYPSESEENYRKNVYKDNKAKIEQHNSEYQAGTHTYDMQMNEYGDMLHHEFTDTMTGFNPLGTKLQGIPFLPSSKEPPPDVDWRTKGAVTEVKSQKDCGSCYTFSATGSIESQWFFKTGKLITLSEQNLIDCTNTTKYKNKGCNGGTVDRVFQYVIDNKGIALESAYPYENLQGACRYTNASNSGVIVTGFVDIPEDEEKLRQAVASAGPVSIAIDAHHDSFQFYHSGVFSDPKCSSFNLTHAVLIVGYGTDSKKNDYWIVKNSWGTNWGLAGYVHMARNKNNSCGITTLASYPLV